jgi:hypothetical protein
MDLPDRLTAESLTSLGTAARSISASLTPDADSAFRAAREKEAYLAVTGDCGEGVMGEAYHTAAGAWCSMGYLLLRATC